MQRKLSLNSPSEWAGAHKVIAALKKAKKIRGPVRLERNPATPSRKRRTRKYGKPRYRPTDAEWAKMRELLTRAKRFANPRKRNVAAGFVDEDGIFHPIRASFDYNRGRAGEGRPKTAKGRKGSAARARKRKSGKRKRNTSYASFRRQGRQLSKKQEFVRRMRLGKRRAARQRR